MGVGAVVVLLGVVWCVVCGTSPVPACRKAHSAGVVRDASGHPQLLVFGGKATEKDVHPGHHGPLYLNDMWSLSITSQQSSWKLLTPPSPLPVPRWKASAVVEGNDLLVVAGLDVANKPLLDTWRFDPVKVQWSEVKTSTPEGGGIEAASAVSTRDHVFLIGGKNALTGVHDAGDRAQILVMKGDKGWFNLNTTFAGGARHGSMATTVPRNIVRLATPVPEGAHGGDDQIVVLFGGRHQTRGGNNIYYNDLWGFQWSKGDWFPIGVAKGSPFPPARDHHGVVYAGGMLYTFGGRAWHNPLVALGDLWAYEFNSRVWRELQPSGPRPLPRFFHIMEPWEDTTAASSSYTPAGPGIVLFGGEAPVVPRGQQSAHRAARLNDAWLYDFHTGAWRLLNEPIHCHTTLVGKVLAVTGEADPLEDGTGHYPVAGATSNWNPTTLGVVLGLAFGLIALGAIVAVGLLYFRRKGYVAP